jgi:hypothetical protein
LKINSLYFSLLAGNLGGEEFARDCILRHAVIAHLSLQHWAAATSLFGGINGQLGFCENAHILRQAEKSQ